ncbi:MAG: UDP-3-O-acyl-N-acetylglucosamine deacetylase [Rickettsiales bacterium]
MINKQLFSKQTTLRNKISCEGVGVHSGDQITMTISPSVAGSGIVFKRTDVQVSKSFVSARFDAVCDTKLGTRISNEYGVTVSTVEHLMAALWGVGIDNALIELDNSEVPIMDGSSEPFIFMLECAGVAFLDAPRNILRVLKTVEVREGTSMIRISPNKEGDAGMLLNIEIDFSHSLIGKQTARYDFRDVTFKQSVSRARTFGFEHEATSLRAMGLVLGASLDNTVVLSKDAILNHDGLRYGDEFVRHKALDCVGDLFLAGVRIDGVVDCSRPGHSINNSLLRALFADESAYVIESEDSIPSVLPSVEVVESVYA